MTITRAFIVFLPGLMLCACSPPSLQYREGFAQGTTYHITWWSEPVQPAASVAGAVEAEFARLDKLLSTYRDDSELQAFNRKRTTTVEQVSPEIVNLLVTAKNIHDLSNGCYDPTIKPLFDLWGFAGDEPTIPNDRRLQDTLAHVGLDKLEIVGANHLRKLDSELSIDLSSIGQGYSVGRIAELLERRGINNYLVEIGGELKVKGRKPDNSSWRIAIEKPLPGKRSVSKILTLTAGAEVSVMTSGTYRHFFDKQGKRYSHILDARTGRPVTHSLVSVTVLHPVPSLADAWSTALLCLGPEDALALADRQGIAALLIEDRAGQLREHASRALQSPLWSLE